MMKTSMTILINLEIGHLKEELLMLKSKWDL
jgi:hypothetical protein